MSSGNLSHSMRENYAAHGVEEYYNKVGKTYRNPHFPGIKSCLFTWLSRWYRKEHTSLKDRDVIIFDMACALGSGEVTVAIRQWHELGFGPRLQTVTPKPSGSGIAQTLSSPPHNPTNAPPLANNEFRPPVILAADPFTAEAYQERTGVACSSLSFRDIAEGALPAKTDSSQVPRTSNTSNNNGNAGTSQDLESPSKETHLVDEASEGLELDMAICSFALHLIESPSELFALLWELSTKTRWLVILAPHKKPEIKDGWGWAKWDVDAWETCSSHTSHGAGEILKERVHCRVYRSTNLVTGAYDDL